MVSKFPWEVKVAEFGLARDLSRLTSRHSNRWRNPRVGEVWGVSRHPGGPGQEGCTAVGL